MKTNLRILTLFAILSSVCATNLRSQTTYTWSGVGDGVSLAVSNNWIPIGLPDGLKQDTAQWNGLTKSNLLINYGSGFLPDTGLGTLGITLSLTPNQTNSVQIISTNGESHGLGLFGINIASNAGPFTLGDNSASGVRIITRPAGAIHHFVNNSTNPATINPNVLWVAGGGNGYTDDFSGTGDWIVNSDLIPDNNAFSPTSIQVGGPGSVYWFGGAAGNYIPDSLLGTITVNGGALLINRAEPLYFANPAPTAIVNSGMLGGSGMFSGSVTIAAGGTLAPGAAIGSIGTLTVSNDLIIGGNLAMELDKSSSNDFVIVTGILTNSGTGILRVSNLGPPLAFGDTFTLFNKPVQNGGRLSIIGAGVLWANHLALDGGITAIGPSLDFTASQTNTLQLSWITNFGHFKLQMQSNSLTVGLSTNWVDYPGGDTNQITVPANPGTDILFFRLVPIP